MRNAQPSASSALRCHRIRAWSAPKQLEQFSQEVGPSLALKGRSRGSREATSAFRLRAVFCVSPPSVCFSARTFLRPLCSLGAPGTLRKSRALVGSQPDKPSVKPPRVLYSALRLLAASFRACQPPNPSIERDVQGLAPLAAPHVKRYAL